MEVRSSEIRLPPPAPAFRLFTRESVTKITKRIQEEKAAKELQKEREQESGVVLEEKKDEEKLKPNPQLEQGATLPAKMGEFPPEMFGLPIEDVDEYYFNKYDFNDRRETEDS